VVKETSSKKGKALPIRLEKKGRRGEGKKGMCLFHKKTYGDRKKPWRFIRGGERGGRGQEGRSKNRRGNVIKHTRETSGGPVMSRDHQKMFTTKKAGNTASFDRAIYCCRGEKSSQPKKGGTCTGDDQEEKRENQRAQKRRVQEKWLCCLLAEKL